MCLNPLKRVNSILTMKIDTADAKTKLGLNPLKRVNSILTDLAEAVEEVGLFTGSQSPQAGQFNSYYVYKNFYCKSN